MNPTVTAGAWEGPWQLGNRLRQERLRVQSIQLETDVFPGPMVGWVGGKIGPQLVQLDGCKNARDDGAGVCWGTAFIAG